MPQRLPGWFRALFTLVMLALCCVLVTTLIHQTNAQTQSADLQDKIEYTRKRLTKQQVEYEQYTGELPQVEAELAVIAPQADAAVARVNELKEQRKTLRAENQEIASRLSELLAQQEAGNTEFLADPQNITQYLDEAALNLDALSGLFGD